jgi:hypothetical protein
VRGFGNVHHLNISFCRQIAEVRNLSGKIEFLTLSSCAGLRSVELSNQDYIHVKILQCNYLDNFRILGTVYSMEFTLNKRWTKEMISRKYQYLNGKEKEE